MTHCRLQNEITTKQPDKQLKRRKQEVGSTVHCNWQAEAGYRVRWPCQADCEWLFCDHRDAAPRRPVRTMLQWGWSDEPSPGHSRNAETLRASLVEVQRRHLPASHQATHGHNYKNCAQSISSITVMQARDIDVSPPPTNVKD